MRLVDGLRVLCFQGNPIGNGLLVLVSLNRESPGLFPFSLPAPARQPVRWVSLTQTQTPGSGPTPTWATSAGPRTAPRPCVSAAHSPASGRSCGPRAGPMGRQPTRTRPLVFHMFGWARAKKEQGWLCGRPGEKHGGWVELNGQSVLFSFFLSSLDGF